MSSPYEIGQVLIFHSPYTGEDLEVSLRGWLVPGVQAMVVLLKREPDPHGEEGDERQVCSGGMTITTEVAHLRVQESEVPR